MTVAKIEYVEGDATQPQGEGRKIIPHICNDVGAWGKGFVLALSRRWPEPEREYRRWFRGELPLPFELGRVQFVQVEPAIWVANIIGQHGLRPRKGIPPIRYDAVRQGLRHVADFAVQKRAEVHMPRIGAGLAGGDWETINRIIQEELCGRGLKVVVYDLPRKR